MTSMKAYVIDPQVPNGLSIVEKPIPEVGPGMALVRVRATSLNYRDHMIKAGGYGSSDGLAGTIPLSDGVGDVAAAGSGVTRVKAGDRVAVNFFPHWIDGEPTPELLRSAMGAPGFDGMLAEYVLRPAESLVHIPQHLSYEEAATLPCAAVTAWFALFETFDLKPGMTVVVQGTGGVSVFALQFAKAAGARVIATSSKNEKLARAKALGADDLINYAEAPEWDKVVRKLTGKRGADLIVEVGGTGTLEKSINAVKQGGAIAVIGVLSGGAAQINLIPILWKQVRLHGVYVGSRVMFDRMTQRITELKLKPVVEHVFGFNEAAEAYAMQAAQTHFGKVVIRV